MVVQEKAPAHVEGEPGLRDVGHELWNHYGGRYGAEGKSVPVGTITPKLNTVATGGCCRNKRHACSARSLGVSSASRARHNHTTNGRAAPRDDVRRGWSGPDNELIGDTSGGGDGRKRDGNARSPVQEEHPPAIIGGQCRSSGSDARWGWRRVEDCPGSRNRELGWSSGDKLQRVAARNKERSIHESWVGWVVSGRVHLREAIVNPGNTRMRICRRNPLDDCGGTP